MRILTMPFLLLSLFLVPPSHAAITPVDVMTMGAYSMYPPIAHEFSRNIGIHNDSEYIMVISGGLYLLTSTNGTTWNGQAVTLTRTYGSGGSPNNHHGIYGDLNGNVYWTYVWGCQGRLGIVVPRYFMKASYRDGALNVSTARVITDSMNHVPNFFCSYTGFGGYALGEDTMVFAYQWTDNIGDEYPHVLITRDAGLSFEPLGGLVAVDSAHHQPDASGWGMNQAPQVVKYKTGIMAVWTVGYVFRYRYFDGTSWGPVNSISGSPSSSSGAAAFRLNSDENNVYLLTMSNDGSQTLISFIYNGSTWVKQGLVLNQSYSIYNVVNTICGDYVLNFWTHIGTNGTDILCLPYNRLTGTFAANPVTVIADGKGNRNLVAPYVCPMGFVPLAWMDGATTTDKIKFCKIPLEDLVSGSTSAEKRLSEEKAIFPALKGQPNPFNGSTILTYHLSKKSEIRLTVYNTEGKKVASLVDGQQGAGTYRISWNPGQLAPGVYFARLLMGERQYVEKLAMTTTSGK
ncbi:MAG: T9SS type A sorting domain-containing protein [Fibrobacterota bacterium]